MNTIDDDTPRPLPKPSEMKLLESVRPEVPEVSLVFDIPPRGTNFQTRGVQNKVIPEYLSNNPRSFSESIDSYRAWKCNQVEDHGMIRERTTDISPRFDRFSQISDTRQVTFSPSVDRIDNSYRETEVYHDNGCCSDVGLKNYYNKPTYKNGTFDSVTHNHGSYNFSDNTQRSNNFKPHHFQGIRNQSNNCMCLSHNESKCIEKPSINLYNKAERLHDCHLSNRSSDALLNVQLQQTVEKHEAQLKFMNEKLNELATNSYASQLMKKYEERIENICEIFKNKFVTADEFEKILQKYSEKINFLENQNKQLLISLDNLRSSNLTRNEGKCCIHCKGNSQTATGRSDLDERESNREDHPNVNFVEIENNPIGSIENGDQISNNTPRNQILKEVQSGNVANSNVGIKTNGQSPRINQNYEPMMRETNHTTEGKVELSWTFYNRIVEDVRRVMHNDDQPERREPNRLQQLDPMEMVRKATLEHLQKMGISLTNNGHYNVNEENEPRPVLSRNREDLRSPISNNNYMQQDKDLSYHMNSLALKYVSDDYAPLNVEERTEPGTSSPINNNNISMATLQYLQRYHILPQSLNTPTEPAKKPYQLLGYNEETGKYMIAPSSNRMLDATAIRQQPKLL